MQRLIQHEALRRSRTNHELRSPFCCKVYATGLWALLLGATLMLAGCSSSSKAPQNSAALSGNWQFTMANASTSFLGGLQGGFLLQSGSTVTGAAVYLVSLQSQSGGNSTICNSGSAPITGTMNGQNVTLTAVAGTQTFSFTGMLTSDTSGTTISGNYTSTAGTAADGSACGDVQSNQAWSATLVPPLTGQIQGSFHSTGGPGGLANQNFPLTGVLIQGQNIGASNATVTGSISFIDPVSGLSDYPCFDTASLNGQISGNSVILQIIGSDGSNLGQIGGSASSALGTVTFDSTARGYLLHAKAGIAYAVNSKKCQGVGLSNAGDVGNICLSMTSAACQQPVTLTPAFLNFTPQPLGSTSTQTITLTNNSSGATLTGLQIQFPASIGSFSAPSDFNGLPNFTELDTCAAPAGSTFSLTSGQSCSITVSFSPQESCPWLPFGTPPSISGAAPSLCPFPLTALLSVSSPSSADNDTNFAVPITGFGSSAITPSTSELDFGAEALSQASLPQQLSFTNHSALPVQILSSAPCLIIQNTLPRPLLDTSPVAGLQVVANGPGSPGGNIGVSGDSSTINYSCDSDPTTLLPNFQISSDTCRGTLLSSQATCSLQIAYVPQAGTSLGSGLDFFLELNTVQCTSATTSSCEIDSGRFPVELKANPPSPLRMSPGAGLDFGIITVGHPAVAQTITLFNDPTDPNTATVNFVGKIAVQGDYSETDNCPFSLPPGSVCTLTIGFSPKITGIDLGTLTINYTPEPTGGPQTIYLRGSGQ